MKNSKIRYIAVIALLIIGIILIRSNVTATKETTKNTGDISVMSLEVNSDLVQKVVSKLTLLDQSVVDDRHKEIYFVGYEDKKELTDEERLFIVLEDLYSTNQASVTKEENIEYLTLSLESLKERFAYLFQIEDIDIKNIDYNVAELCGITELSYSDENVQLKINKCEPDKGIEYKIENATKKGDYLYLDLKAFAATKKIDKVGNTNIKITNFDDKKSLKIVNEMDFESHIDDYFKELDIDTFRFTFLLKGDDYYLENIKRDL